MALITPEQRLQRVKDYPLIHFASVLGLSRTGTFHTARSYTTFPAALIWVCRAICLFNWLPPNPESPSALFISDRRGTDEIRAHTTHIPQTKAERIPNNDNKEDLEEEEAEAILSAQAFLDQPKEDRDGSDQGQSDLNPSNHSDQDQDKEEQLLLPITSTYPHRFALFRQQQEQYLVFDSEYPFSELSSLLAVGLKLGRSQGEGDLSEESGVVQIDSPSVRHVMHREGRTRASKVVNGVKRRYTEAFTSDSEGSELVAWKQGKRF